MLSEIWFRLNEKHFEEGIYHKYSGGKIQKL